MGLPAKEQPPDGDQSHTETAIIDSAEAPANVITIEQVKALMHDEFEQLTSAIRQQIDQKFIVFRGEVEEQMKESEDRSKKYTDSQVDNIERETKKHIGSVENLVHEVVRNLRKSLEETTSEISTKFRQWNGLFSSAQQSISNIHQVSADLQAGQRDLEKGHRQQASQIDNLQEHDMKQVQINADIRRDVDTATRNTSENTTIITNLIARFDSTLNRLDPMAEFYTEQLKTQKLKAQRKLERSQNRRAVLKLLFGVAGNARVLTVLGTLLTLLFARVAAVTGIDLSPNIQGILDFFENLLRGL